MDDKPLPDFIGDKEAMTQSDPIEQIMAILNLNRQRLIAWDDALYQIESVVRAAQGKVGARAHRAFGILSVNFEDGRRVYDY